MTLFITPEHYGAAADGTTDDGAAIQQAVAAAVRTGEPLHFQANAIYAIGSQDWVGISAQDVDLLRILGNGALIKLLVAPTQMNEPGNAGNPIFKISGSSSNVTGRVLVEGLRFDLGNFPVAAISFYNCTLNIKDCRFTNGAARNSYMLQAHHCSGKIENCHGSHMCEGFYLGHSGAGAAQYSCFDFEVTGCSLVDNREQDDGQGLTQAGHLVMGTFRDTIIHSNYVRNVWNFVVCSGYDLSGQTCERVVIANNRCEGVQASAVQTDYVIAGGGIRARQIKVIGNIFSRSVDKPGSSPVGIYMIHAEDFTVENNQFLDYENCVVVDEATRGTIRGNTGLWTGAVPGWSEYGIFLQAATAKNVTGDVTGGTSEIDIDGNTMIGFVGGICIGGVGGEAYSLRNIRVTGNTILHGTTGILRGRVTGSDESMGGIKITGNTLFGNVHDLYLAQNDLDDELRDNSYRTFSAEAGASAFGPAVVVPAGFNNVVIGRARKYLISGPGTLNMPVFSNPGDPAASDILSEGDSLTFHATGAVTFGHTAGLFEYKGGQSVTVPAGGEIVLRKLGGVIREVSRSF